MNFNFWIILLLPLLGTMIGSAFVFTIKDHINPRAQKGMLGFAAGVMVAASVWSLLIPAMELQAGSGKWQVFPASIGLLIGFAFLYVIDVITPHLHLDGEHAEGPRSRLSRTSKLALAVTIHNLPEGMAVGVVLGAALNGGAQMLSAAGAMAVAIGIAVQNVPEGAIVAMPMRAAGNTRLRSFTIGTLSGVVEPIGAIAVVLLTSVLGPALPYLLGFAAGAMLYVVVEELIPEGSEGEHSNMATLGFALGFVLMMVLDVVLG